MKKGKTKADRLQKRTKNNDKLSIHNDNIESIMPIEIELSADLRKELGADMPVTVHNPQEKLLKKRQREEAEKSEIVEKLSKKKRMKLEKIKAKKQLADKRIHLSQLIHSKSLSESQRELLTSSSAVGQRETLKQKLKKDLKRKRAGLEEEEHIDEGVVEEEVEEDVDVDVDVDDEIDKDFTHNISHEIIPEVNHIKSTETIILEKEDKVMKEEVKVEVKRSDNPPSVPNDIKKLKPVSAVSAMSAPEILRNKAYYVSVDRKPEIQAARMELPVCAMEQEIMEAINFNNIVILCGETGSGKTTQVPQFLYEAGYGMKDSGHEGIIGVTQPRRVAAVSMARRVSEELNTVGGSIVAHQVRYDSGNVKSSTRIKFMTDGILLREIQQDFLLNKYSVLILDEAHERTLNTDLLLGLLSRIVPLRAKLFEEGQASIAKGESLSLNHPTCPLKLVIMSATLRVTDFSENPRLFPVSPVVINVQARQHPVTIHFNRTTEFTDYIGAALKKVSKIHRTLPPGGILVFMTGSEEIETLCTRLRNQFDPEAIARRIARRAAARERSLTSRSENPVNSESEMTERLLPRESSLEDEKAEPLDDLDGQYDEEEIKLEKEEARMKLNKVEVMEGDSGEGEVDNNSDEEEEDLESMSPAIVLPLYAMLPNNSQMKVFMTPPEGHRLIVVATNVAETSITIPNIKYVVDAGREKRRVFDPISGVSKFEVSWISQASANQRAGRAGRTGPGHCYRLFSSSVFNHEFSKFADPEVLRLPLDNVVMTMKRMDLSNITSFPFPTSPDPEALSKAVNMLTCIGALEKTSEKLTKLGLSLSVYPISPRFAKMLVIAQESGILVHISCIVAALSVGDPFLHGAAGKLSKEISNLRSHLGKDHDDYNSDDGSVGLGAEDAPAIADTADLNAKLLSTIEIKREIEAKLNQWKDPSSDALSLLRAVGAYLYESKNTRFCSENFLHAKTMKEIVLLHKQLLDIMKRKDDIIVGTTDMLKPPTASQKKLIAQTVASGLLDQIARKMTPSEALSLGTAWRRGSVPYVAADTRVTTPLFIHRNSSVYSSDGASLPNFVAYSELVNSANDKTCMKGVTAIEGSWLSNISAGTANCSYSDPVETPTPFYDGINHIVMCYCVPRYGPGMWELPLCKREYPEGIERVKWFARLLLEGHVISAFKELSPYLNSNPAQITRSTVVQKKIESLIAILVKDNIDNDLKLFAKWKKSPQFLQREITSWIQPAFRYLISDNWIQIIEEK